MGINARSSIDPRYKNHAWVPLRGFANATIRLIDPNTDSQIDDYNAFTNVQHASPIVLWSGQGQLNVFRQTLNAFMPAQGITQIRSLRFVVPGSGPSMPVRKGLHVRVVECPDQPDACLYQYTITSGITGTLAFARDFEAEADMGVIQPTGDGFGEGGYGLDDYGT